jgi:hypothetical protein
MWLFLLRVKFGFAQDAALPKVIEFEEFGIHILRTIRVICGCDIDRCLAPLLDHDIGSRDEIDALGVRVGRVHHAELVVNPIFTSWRFVNNLTH